MFRPNNQIVWYLKADEYLRLLTAAEKIRWYLRPVIEIAANTGLRRGNILELRWDECDTPTGIAGIGLRFSQSGSFTSIPTVPQNGNA